MIYDMLMFAGRHSVSIIGSNWCLSEQLGNHTTLRNVNFRTIHCTVWDPGTYRQCCHLLHKSHLRHLWLRFTGDGRACQWCTSRSKSFRSIERWVFYNSSTALFVSPGWCTWKTSNVRHSSTSLSSVCLTPLYWFLSLPEHLDSRYSFIK